MQLQPPHRSKLVHDPGFLAYDFGPQHPLRPERITAGLDLLGASDLWNADHETLSPAQAEENDLELMHDRAYILAVKEAGSGRLPGSELIRFGMGPGDTPAFPGMHQAAALVTGGSIQAVHQIMSGDIDHAFNPAGGLHHAHRARASGFCVYNDPAVAAAVAMQNYDAKVLYVDFDCHHGDGVQWGFYAEPRVMTVSFHETGRYLFPGTGDVEEMGEGAGAGTSINLPMAPYTQDASWVEAIRTVVPALTDRFRPDLIISSHGADTHVWDPLTHLALTTVSFVEQARLIHDLAHQYAGGRWLAVGSGGYDWQRVVPRAWAIVWSEMTSRPLPEDLPRGWAGRWTVGAPAPFPQLFMDPPDLVPDLAERDMIATLNRRALRQARDAIRLARL